MAHLGIIETADSISEQDLTNHGQSLIRPGKVYDNGVEGDLLDSKANQWKLLSKP